MENNKFIEHAMNKELAFVEENSLKLQLLKNKAPVRYGELLQKINYTETVIREALQLGNIRKAMMYTCVLQKLVGKLKGGLPEVEQFVLKKFKKIK
ncbi:hypothetical protein AALT52_01915 [Ligilactobacillus faecis]|uniref:Uncharacterized protein n=1 Tax=Ligilactobacillus faecis TaxID=762833 RepID=A0ABV4DN05_9LACO